MATFVPVRVKLAAKGATKDWFNALPDSEHFTLNFPRIGGQMRELGIEWEDCELYGTADEDGKIWYVISWEKIEEQIDGDKSTWTRYQKSWRLAGNSHPLAKEWAESLANMLKK